jgi:hypothetical protein
VTTPPVPTDAAIEVAKIVSSPGLNALPVGSVVLDRDGDAWQKGARGWTCADRSSNTQDVPAHDLVVILGPLRPLAPALDVPTITAQVREEGRQSARVIIRQLHDEDWPHIARVALSHASARVCGDPPWDKILARSVGHPEATR